MLRTRRAPPLAGALLASSLFTAGCLDPDTTDPDSEPAGVAGTDKAYVLADNVWRSNVLTVCWEQSGLDAEKLWVRDAIRRTWEAESTVQFIGWQKCDGSKWHLRVELADERGRTRGLGNDLFDESSGVRLNTWAKSNGNCAPGWDRERCVRSTAVHEFGHALGFAHEQNRGDTPSTCKEEQGTDGTEVVGDWDVMSVMNYCNPVRNGDARLSGTDIAAIQRYYGAPQLTSTVSMAPGRIDMFGRTRDNAIWQRTFENGQWGAQVYLGGQASSPPVAVSWGPGRIDLFARGLDGWLYHRASDQSWGGTWTPWTSLERTIQGTPAVVAWGPNRLDVFARSSDGTMIHRAWAGTYWSHWVDLGLPFIGTPSAVSWGPGRIDLFARGLDSQLYHLAWDGAVSSGWVAHGGLLTSDPAPTTWGPNRLDIFARGPDAALHRLTWDGAGWSGWQPQGSGYLIAGPTAVASAPGQINVFVRDWDGAVLRNTGDGVNWVWSSHGTFGVRHDVVDKPLIPKVDAVSWGPNRADMLFADYAGDVYQTTWEGGSWSGWSSAGGRFY